MKIPDLLPRPPQLPPEPGERLCALPPWVGGGKAQFAGGRVARGEVLVVVEAGGRVLLYHGLRGGRGRGEEGGKGRVVVSEVLGGQVAGLGDALKQDKCLFVFFKKNVAVADAGADAAAIVFCLSSSLKLYCCCSCCPCQFHNFINILVLSPFPIKFLTMLMSDRYPFPPPSFSPSPSPPPLSFLLPWRMRYRI